MADPSSLIHPSKSPRNPTTTPFPGFLYKAVFVCVLVALPPIFPPHSPEPPNRTLLARAWELLHLLLVGLAISYGLFSRRNSDHDVADKEAHSHASSALHVPSVFEEDEEEPVNETKAQAWNYARHSPGEPVVVVAAEESSTSDAKPLFLPVRSLKSTEGDGDGDGGKAGAVLPSPVPWRSRSGRTEAKEPPSPPVPAAEAELCPSVSQEIRAEIGEDSGRKKSFSESSPPPAPPASPPLVHGHNIGAKEKDGRKSFKYELERFLGSDELVLDHPGPDSSRAKEARRPRTLPTRRGRKKNGFRERMIIDSSDSDAESETSDVGELPISSGPAGPEENEVDKKADEFIAKFREQIRLQRIASNKRSSTAARRDVTSRS